MATLYITEFADVGHMPQIVATGSELSVNDQTVAISGSHAESSALKNNTRLVRLHTDAICSVVFGTAPAATTSNRRLAANQTEYFTVPSGSAYKVSVISNT